MEASISICIAFGEEYAYARFITVKQQIILQ